MSKYFAVIRELMFTEDLEGKREDIWGMAKVTETGLRIKCLGQSEKQPSLVWAGVHVGKKRKG